MINDEIKNKISAWVDAHESELIADIARLVAIKSVKGEPEENAPFGAGPARALAEAVALCGERGFATKVYDNAIATADLNDLPAALDILGHLDVVGEGALDGWDTDPYTLTVKDDGCAYGRGGIDDKGPVVAALYAMICVRELGLPLKAGVRLIMGTDEESGSDDLPHYYAHNSPAPNTVSPDANFPVYNTEKGFYKPVFTRKYEKTAARPAVVSLEGGYRINVLPADATALIAGIAPEEVERIVAPLAPSKGVSFTAAAEGEGPRLTVKGKNAHASLPEDGVNGITALVELLLALPLADCGSTEALRALGRIFPHGDSRGKALGIAMSDEISGELTAAFSLLSMTETELRGQFDGRIPICANDENCRRAAEKTFAANGFSATGEMGAPHHTPAGTPFINSLLESYESFTGEKGECLSMGGGTYVHDIEGGVAFGAAMPGFDGAMHGQNEHFCIRDMLTTVKIYAAVIANICG
jgi:succinyl-diaminopimelate desuccinylase